MKRAVSGINTWRVVNQLARDFDLNRSQKEPKEEEEEKREEEEEELEEGRMRGLGRGVEEKCGWRWSGRN